MRTSELSSQSSGLPMLALRSRSTHMLDIGWCSESSDAPRVEWQRFSEGHAGLVPASLSVCHGKELAAVGMDGGRVLLWDISADGSRARPLLRLSASRNHMPVTSTAMDSEGSIIVSGSKDKTVRAWRLTHVDHPTQRVSATPLNTWQLDSEVHCVDIFGGLIVSGAADSFLRLHRCQDLSAPSLTLSRHTQPVTCVRFSPDGTLIASGSVDHSVVLWMRASDQGELAFDVHLVINEHTATVRRLFFAPDASFVVSVGEHGTIRKFKTRGEPEPALLLKVSTAYCYASSSVDGTAMVTVNTNGVIRAHDISSMRTLAIESSWTEAGMIAESKRRTGRNRFFSVECLCPTATSTSFRVLACDSAKLSIVELDPDTGQHPAIPISTPPTHECTVFSADSKYLYHVADHRLLQLSVDTFKATDIGGVYRVYSMAFASAPEPMLATGGINGSIRLWRQESTDEPAWIFTELDAVLHANVCHLQFSPSGKLLLAATDTDQRIHIWRTNDCGHLSQLGLQSCITSLSVSVVPDHTVGKLMLCAPSFAALHLQIHDEDAYLSSPVLPKIVSTVSMVSVSTLTQSALPPAECTLPWNFSLDEDIECCCLSSDGTLLCLALQTSFHLMNVSVTYSGETHIESVLFFSRYQHEDISRLSFSSNNQHLIVGYTTTTQIFKCTDVNNFRIMYGGCGILAPDDSVLAVEVDANVKLVRPSNIQSHVHVVHSFISRACLEEIIDYINIDALLAHVSRFCHRGVIYDMPSALVKELNWDPAHLTALFEGRSEALPVYPMDIRLQSSAGSHLVESPLKLASESALAMAITNGNRGQVKVLVEHSLASLPKEVGDLSTATKAEVRYQSGALQAQCLVVQKALPEMVRLFPDLALTVLERSVLETTSRYSRLGPHEIDTYADQLLPSTAPWDNGFERVRSAVVCLPNVFDTVSDNHGTDVLEALCNQKAALTAFDLPAVQAVLHHRWKSVRSTYWFLHICYLLLIVWSTIFSLHVSTAETISYVTPAANQTSASCFEVMGHSFVPCCALDDPSVVSCCSYGSSMLSSCCAVDDQPISPCCAISNITLPACDLAMCVANSTLTSAMCSSFADLTFQVGGHWSGDAFGVLTLIFSCCFLLSELTLMIGGLKYFSSGWNILALCTYSLTVVYVALYFSHASKSAVLEVAVPAVLLVWFNSLFYLRGVGEGMGIFVRLVLVLGWEIRQFLLLWFVILFGFANAYVILYRSQNPIYPPTMGVTFIEILHGALGGLSPSATGDPSNPANQYFDGYGRLYTLQLFVYLLFTLVCNVLLLNLLIAQLSSIYAEVAARASTEYHREWAKLLIGLENPAGLYFARKTRAISAFVIRLKGSSAGPSVWTHIAAALSAVVRDPLLVIVTLASLPLVVFMSLVSALVTIFMTILYMLHIVVSPLTLLCYGWRLGRAPSKYTASMHAPPEVPSAPQHRWLHFVAPSDSSMWPETDEPEGLHDQKQTERWNELKTELLATVQAEIESLKKDLVDASAKKSRSARNSKSEVNSGKAEGWQLDI